MRFYLETLGCPKNTVDAHGMARLLRRLGHTATDDVRQAQALIVNTCGFIGDARDESLNRLRELAAHKRAGQMLIAAGCLSQQAGRALLQAVPGIDALLGTRRWAEIGRLAQDMAAIQGSGLALLDDPVTAEGDGPRYARQGASAYLKIADGCDAPCAFCSIPMIKGAARSRPAEEVVADAVELVSQGVQELILIAQDTTAYGWDRGERDGLAGLLNDVLVALPARPEERSGPGLPWLRLMYAYPGHVSPRLVEVMASDPRVCHYLDLPLQHAHPDVLRRMRRPADVDRIRHLIHDLRVAMPDLALRTTFIVGYPGETEAEFQVLLDFVEEMRFAHLGAFEYSPEPGTPAYDLPDPVPPEAMEERYDRLMTLQQAISLQLNQAQVGRRLDVLVEGQGDGLSIGRSYRDAPEIDGLVLIEGDHPVDAVIPVRITSALEYDLVGERIPA